MAPWTVPLADVIVTDEDIACVAATYRSGWLSMGPRTAEFEAAFAAYVGVPYACAVSSGTAALHLMCAAAGLGPGDEVLVPSITFVATVERGALRRRDAGPRRHRGPVRALDVVPCVCGGDRAGDTRDSPHGLRRTCR